MVQPLEQKKRQKILLGTLVVVLIITAVVWYMGYNQKPFEEITTSGQLPPGFSATDEKLKELKLELNILDNDLFKSLKSHGVLPVTSGETGRVNPFEQP